VYAPGGWLQDTAAKGDDPRGVRLKMDPQWCYVYATEELWGHVQSMTCHLEVVYGALSHQVTAEDARAVAAAAAAGAGAGAAGAAGAGAGAGAGEGARAAGAGRRIAVTEITSSGHFVLEDRPRQLRDAILNLLLAAEAGASTRPLLIPT